VFSSYSGCRQYLEDIARATAEVGQNAPQPEKLRSFFNHPGFIEPMAERVQAALSEVPENRRAAAHLIFTAHSIPEAMASGCQYEVQLREACRLVVDRCNVGTAHHESGEGLAHQAWSLVYQSRSGPPTQPWLGPDVGDFLRELAAGRTSPSSTADVVLVPIGFISDHMEVLFDLDTEARELCEELGLSMVRAATVGTHPKFVSMIRELILERTAGAEKRWLGELGPSHDVCPADCCPSGARAMRLSNDT
jgi:ferrochelatase